MSQGRTCTRCDLDKIWKEFNLQSNGLNGRASICKECRRMEANAKYAKSKHIPRTDEQKEKAAETSRRSRWRMRYEVIRAYGGVCVCCEEDSLEFLVIDHINGGGDSHRKSIGSPTGGYPFYAKLKKLGYPFRDDLRVLCANCNSSYGSYGYCPHDVPEDLCG